MIFSRKTRKLLHPSLSFCNISLKNSILQKHLAKLRWEHTSITQKISKNVGLLRRFQPVLPRSSPLTIHKTFIRSQLDYADVIYNQTYKSFFHEKLESLQYNACLAIRGTSSEKLYQELRLESLKLRGWFRKLCHFYKILYEKPPSYLFDLIPDLNRVHKTRYSNSISAIHVRHDYFKNSFFPSTSSEWNKLDWEIRNPGSLSIFKKKLLNFIQ